VPGRACDAGHSWLQHVLSRLSPIEQRPLSPFDKLHIQPLSTVLGKPNFWVNDGVCVLLWAAVSSS
jgi:hypothetical protein